MIYNRTILGIFIALIGLGAFSLLSARLPNQSEKFHVELTQDGFSPNEITVTKDSIVTFVNLSDKDTWPASDPHPTHEYLKGFDPTKPIPPGGKWSYKFEETGTFRYHDHLSVSQRGSINVLLPGYHQKSLSYGGKECDGKCFDELVRKTVHDEGIDAAYQLFTETYARGKLPRACHWTAHQIGEATYELFREGKDFTITNSTSYCGFGFYHGFLEGLLRENPNDIEYALSFCDKVQEKLGKMGLYNCVHGIGHGFTEEPPDPKTLGDANAMLKPGIQMCEELFGKTFSNLNLCLTGVYTVTAGFYDKNQYGLAWNKTDPFAFCKTQPYRYQKACYGEFVPKLDEKLKWDLTRIPKYLEGIKDDKILRLIVWVAPSVFISKDILDDDHSKYINDCRKAFTDRLLKICWGGTILGFFTHGEPEKQYIKIINFCNSNLFSSDEKEFCFEEGLRQSRQNYTEQKMKDVCKSVPAHYQKYCFTTYHDPPYDDPSFEQI